VIAPGTVVRRLPGEETGCAACMDSMTGYCKDHREFYSWPRPVPEPEPELEQLTASEDDLDLVRWGGDAG
jgi:hypothetical protein